MAVAIPIHLAEPVGSTRGRLLIGTSLGLPKRSFLPLNEADMQAAWQFLARHLAVAIAIIHAQPLPGRRQLLQRQSAVAVSVEQLEHAGSAIGKRQGGE